MPKFSCGPWHSIHAHIHYMYSCNTHTHTQSLSLFISNACECCMKLSKVLPPSDTKNTSSVNKVPGFYSLFFFSCSSFAPMQNKKLKRKKILYRPAYGFVLLEPVFQVPHKSLDCKHNRSSVRVD